MVVAAFGRWHEHHTAAARALEAMDLMLAPVAIESFSVLTRMPPPRRARPALVRAFLEDHLHGSPFALPASGYRELLDEATRTGISGGAVYDALIALTSRQAGAALITLDLRAARVYGALDVEYRVPS